MSFVQVQGPAGSAESHESESEYRDRDVTQAQAPCPGRLFLIEHDKKSP